MAPARLPDPRYALRLARGFAALVALSFGLIVLGALVRANDAGLACPDWPLCFGQLLPRVNVKVGFEWTHRAVAGALSLVFAALAVLVLRREFTRRACPVLVAAAAALLLVQVLLGALTVWKLLAPWTVTAHLIAGNSFALLLLWISFALRDRAAGAPAPGPLPARARLAVGFAAALLGLQMLLGGLVASRYAGLACPEWPACAGGVFFPTLGGAVGIHLLHRWNAVLLLLALAAAVAAAPADAPRLRRISQVGLALGALQLLVGIANVLLRLPVEVTGLHSALAAGLVLCLAAAAHESWLRPQRAR